MPFELFRKSGFQLRDPAIVFIPAHGRIGLNSAACQILRDAKVEAVFLLWDPAKHAIALKAAKRGDAEAYTLAFHKNGHSATLSGAAFFKWIAWAGSERRTAPATWNVRERRLEALFKKQVVEAKRTRSTKRRESETEN